MPRITDWTGITSFGTNGPYLVRVQVRPFPMRSKRFPKHTAPSTMQEWRQRKIREDRDRKPHVPEEGTIDAAVTTYLSQWGTGKHPITVLHRTRYLHLWAKAFTGRYRSSLTTAEIERQLATWQKDGLPGKRPTPLAPATARKVRQALFQLYAVLDRGTGRANPVADVPAGSDPDPDPGGFPLAVVRAILKALRRSKTKARCYVMAYIGLRPQEVRLIRPHDWEGRTLYVRSAKGSKRVRVPLTRRGAAAMRYFAQLEAWGPFTNPPLDRMLHAAAATAGYPTLRFTAYSLRHSFGTWHYAACRDIKATKEAMRHKSLKMTERYVRAAVDAALQTSIDTLDQRLRADRIADHQRQSGRNS